MEWVVSGNCVCVSWGRVRDEPVISKGSLDLALFSSVCPGWRWELCVLRDGVHVASCEITMCMYFCFTKELG